MKGVECSSDEYVNEKLRGERVEWDAVILELAALGLYDVYFVGDGIEKSPKLALTPLEAVDTASKDRTSTVLGHFFAYPAAGMFKKSRKTPL